MNPIQVTSPNINKFGFKATFDTELKRVTFDITGVTEFDTGGAALVQGIWFEVRDPAGVIFKPIDFAAAPDIDPDVSSVKVVNLPGGIATWGYYQIRGAIKDADGQVYYVTLPAKKICEPVGIRKDGTVPGKFKTISDCRTPKVTISEATNIAYEGLTPIVSSKNGVLYFPDGTAADLPFTFTPFSTANVFTGNYTVRNKTLATYDLGDLVYVNVSYATHHEFKVQCYSRIADIACCIEEVQNDYETQSNNQKGRIAKEKLSAIAPYLLLALSKEAGGKDASAEIERIKTLLGCECADCGPEFVEALPVLSALDYNFNGECAATVTPTQAGNTVDVDVKVKHVQVVKFDSDDLAFSIDRTEDDCNVYYRFSFDYVKLAETIYQTTANNTSLKALLNSLITATNISSALVGIDGRCIIAMSECDYILQEDIATIAPKYITEVVVDGLAFPAPSNLLATNQAGIASWLNSLTVGAFNVVVIPIAGGQRLLITSIGNENVVSTSTFVLVAGGDPIIRQWTASCATLAEVLQAIIDYLCDLTSLQIKTGLALAVCSISSNGNVVMANYGPANALSSYLSALSTAFCDLVNRVSSLAKMKCDDMKALFPSSSAQFAATDSLYGTKGGSCAAVTVKDLWGQLCALLKSDAEARTCLAQIYCVGGTSTCPEVIDFTYTLTSE